MLHLFDLVVGTEEEFHIAGGSTDTLTALKNVRNATKATLVCKRGPMGCVVLEGDIPDSWDQCRYSRACAWRFSTCWAPGMPLCRVCCAAGSTTKAGSRLAVTPTPAGRWWSPATAARRRCRPKSNSTTTCSAPESVPRPDVDERLNHLHRVTSRRQQWPELCIFAFDHRKQLADLARETGRDEACIPQLKLLLLAAAEAAAQEAGLDQRSGILADGTYGQRALNAITGKGWWIGRPIELPSSRPLRLEHGNIGSQLIDWPLEHVVKCLVFYHPDDPAALRAEQDALLLEVWQACNKSGHELLLEVILPENGPDKDERHYHTMLEHFYQLGIAGLVEAAAALQRQLAADHRPYRARRSVEPRDPDPGLDAPSDKLRAGFAEAAAQSDDQRFRRRAHHLWPAVAALDAG